MNKILIYKKNNYFNQNLPENFLNYKFLNFENTNQKQFFELLKKRSKCNFFPKISKKKHLEHVRRYSKLSLINFIIFNNKTKEIVGFTNLKKTRLGYEIGKAILNTKYLNKNIMKYAALNTIKFIFKNLKIKKIISRTNINNYKNISLNLKIGFEIKRILNKNLIMSLTNVRFYNHNKKKQK